MVYIVRVYRQDESVNRNQIIIYFFRLLNIKKKNFFLNSTLSYKYNINNE